MEVWICEDFVIAGRAWACRKRLLQAHLKKRWLKDIFWVPRMYEGESKMDFAVSRVQADMEVV